MCLLPWPRVRNYWVGPNLRRQITLAPKKTYQVHRQTRTDQWAEQLDKSHFAWKFKHRCLLYQLKNASRYDARHAKTMK